MSNEEVIKRLSAYITCLKCEISGKECDANCPTEYEAGTMGEVVKALETVVNTLKVDAIPTEWIHQQICNYPGMESAMWSKLLRIWRREHHETLDSEE